MFGLGRKDKDGEQDRMTHWGKYARASRTGGFALRAEERPGPISATANTSDGTYQSFGVPLKSRLIGERRL